MRRKLFAQLIQNFTNKYWRNNETIHCFILRLSPYLSVSLSRYTEPNKEMLELLNPNKDKLRA